MIFCIFYQVSFTGSGLFKCDLCRNRLLMWQKMQENHFLLLKKLKKYRKCPALLAAWSNRSRDVLSRHTVFASIIFCGVDGVNADVNARNFFLKMWMLFQQFMTLGTAQWCTLYTAYCHQLLLSLTMLVSLFLYYAYVLKSGMKI